MNTEETWISVKTLSEIKNVTARAIRLSLPKSNYVFREIPSHGGKCYEILLSSLEARVQEIYKNKYYEKIVELENQINLIPVSKSVQTQTDFIPETAKTIALARVDLVLEWQKFRNKNLPRQKGDKVFLEIYNSGEYLKNVFFYCRKNFKR